LAKFTSSSTENQKTTKNKVIKMAYTEAEKKEIQIKMYGCTEAEVFEGLENSLLGARDWEMYVGSILSDAQHVMAHGDVETARQFINKAKAIMFKKSDERREAEYAAYEAKSKAAQAK
jgi:hypothetical protein